MTGLVDDALSIEIAALTALDLPDRAIRIGPAAERDDTVAVWAVFRPRHLDWLVSRGASVALQVTWRGGPKFRVVALLKFLDGIPSRLRCFAFILAGTAELLVGPRPRPRRPKPVNLIVRRSTIGLIMRFPTA
jgi:hypothetical protein